MSASDVFVELVQETLHVARKLNISRLEAAKRMLEVMGQTVRFNKEMFNLYAAMIRHETTEQWCNVKDYEQEIQRSRIAENSFLDGGFDSPHGGATPAQPRR